MTKQELEAYLSQIPSADRAAMDAAKKRQAQLAKPPGSLGRLEELTIRLAGVTGQVHNHADNCRIAVFAADNGVVCEGVSSAPQSVTLSQAVNMTHGITGMSAMAHCFGNSVCVVDVGIAADGTPHGILPRKVRRGTENIRKAPAMTEAEALRAISVGIEQAERARADGVQALGMGEMGIGNTTTATAVLCALTGASVQTAVGRGGGLTDAAFARKALVITEALSLHRPDRNDVLDVLAKVGGLDIAAMTGAYLGCARNRIPAVVDGLISVVAALCAVRLCPRVRDFLFLSHASYERGYRIAAEELGAQPCLLLEMRLGEGSGCPIMFQVMKAACAAMNGMATFSEAAINDGYLDEIRKTDAFTVRPI